MENKRKFAEMMSTMGIIFGKEIDKALNRIYWECLKKFSDEDVELSVKKILETSKWFPKPSEIIEIIKENREPELTAPSAWGMVMAGLESGRVPKDAAIQDAIRRVGGWDYLKGKSYDELHWIEKRFVEHFGDISEHRRFDDQLAWDEETKLLE